MASIVRFVPLLLVMAILIATVRVHHDPAGPADDHDRHQQELCTEVDPPAGHHDHDAPGAPCSSPTHCSHGCSGHHLVDPASPRVLAGTDVLTGVVHELADALLSGASRAIEHPPKA